MPSLTKTICEFGLADQIVGITSFCVDPPDLWRRAQRVGGTKDPNIQAIYELAPTHVVVNSEENRDIDIDRLKMNLNVLNTFPKSPRDVPQLLTQMGQFLSCENVAALCSSACERAIAQIGEASGEKIFKGKKFLYLIWRDPWMAAGRDTYISRFLEMVGLENVLSSDERYPVIDPSSFAPGSVDIVLMSSEPWPFRKRDAEALASISGPRNWEVFWIDGKAMSWYGSETVTAIETWLKQTPPVRRLI